MVTLAELCSFIISEPYQLLNETPAVRRAVLERLIAFQSIQKSLPDFQVKQNARLAGSALAAYLKAGLSEGCFALKLSELIELGMSPFFEWLEGGQSRGVLDAVMHFGASDSALLLVKCGIGYGYLSLPLYDSAPKCLSFGSLLGYKEIDFPPVKPSTSHGGCCLAHVLAQHGSLQEIACAVACGLNFTHSSTNVPYPLVLAALHNRAEVVTYFLELEEQLKTVQATLDHAVSRKFLMFLGGRSNLSFQKIHTSATANYSKQLL